MGKVSTQFSMSLDGFIAGPNDGPDNSLGDGGERLFQWYFTGAQAGEVPNGDGVIKMNQAGAEMIHAASQTVGVLVTGRRTFDIARAWGGRHPLDVPMVVVTHRVPQEWVKPGSPFTFITDGVEHAIAVAQKIAGEKIVAIGAPSIAQQCIQAGLVDEIGVDLVPYLLGAGVRLFDHLGVRPIELECTSVEPAPGVIHLAYQVVK